MPTSEQCRKLADECRRNAKEADEADERDMNRPGFFGGHFV
jgi:hypothetical protein